MNFKNLTSIERVAYLIKPIIQALQESGGQLTRDEIAEKITAADDDIAEYASIVSTSKKTGKDYSKFKFKFNFAIKDLSFVDIVTFEKRNPVITLTDKGESINLDNFDVDKEVMEPAAKCWDELRGTNKRMSKVQNEDEIVEDEIDIQAQYNDEIKERILAAISKMSPKKFEQFSRQLLTKMGVKFTEQGTQISNDGGIDGFGYHQDPDDFRTSKVVIQCKRYNGASVNEPTINGFLGAMNKFQADYGIIITNSKFTKAARAAALQGQPITLIDGDKLVDLIIKYQLGIQPITTYELLDLYDEE